MLENAADIKRNKSQNSLMLKTIEKMEGKIFFGKIYAKRHAQQEFKQINKY